MKKVKSTVCLLTVFAIIMPLTLFSASVEPDFWYGMSAKYSERTGNICRENGEIQTSGFELFENGDGGISVKVPDYDTFSGADPVTAVSFKKETSLDGLSIVINPDDFEFSINDCFSLLWTEKPVTAIADYEAKAGLYNRAEAGENGLRNLIPKGSRGLCINVKAADSNKNGTKTATAVSIIYYDGITETPSEGLGCEWEFTENKSNINPLNEIPRQDSYENIDITYGLVITVKEDDSLGYVVNINGKDYGNIKSDLYPYWDVNLKPLKEIKYGYITVGASFNLPGKEDIPKNYTISYINTLPAASWGKNSAACFHEFEQTVEKKAQCTVNGIILNTCSFCGYSYESTIPATGHVFGEYISNNDADCTNDGTLTAKCIYCSETDTKADTQSAKDHSFTEWIVTEPATYFNEGWAISFCDLCGAQSEAEPIPMLEYIPMDDVDTEAWYAKGVEYCVKKGYILGNDNSAFDPAGELTREQMLTIMGRAAGIKPSEYTNIPFTDVKAEDWFAPYVIWGYEEGIVQGVGNNEFGVGRVLTRQEFATILYRYGTYDEDMNVGVPAKSFLDMEDIARWAQKSVEWAAKNGILGSVSKNEPVFAPEMAVTRAQAAKIFMSFDEYVEKNSIN